MTATPEVRSVWQVTRYLRELVESDRRLADLWIGGEVSNLTLAQSGHIYFTLKDQGGQLRCVFFRKQNMGQRDRLETGKSVIVHGGVSVYEARGDLQFIVDFVQAAGVGALQAEFERRRAQFEAEGLFAPDRKRPLPRFPRTIGVVTSANGAAFHDIQTVLARRWPFATLRLMPAQVQGEEAAISVAEGVRQIAPHHQPEVWPDLVIVGRGGGSAEDLWAFNEEPVIRAIFGCPVPVVSAVGHETDVSLADLVADVRAPTPSAAAELVAPDRAEVLRSITQMQMRQQVRIARAIAEARERVDRAGTRLERGLPDIAGRRHHIHTHVEAMRRATTAATTQARERVGGLASGLRALSPAATLDRGYALVATDTGDPVARASAVREGDRIQIRWHDGSQPARVESRP